MGFSRQGLPPPLPPSSPLPCPPRPIPTPSALPPHARRDVKPNNFLVASDGVLKLADFGLSRLLLSPERGRPYTNQVWEGRERRKERGEGFLHWPPPCLFSIPTPLPAFPCPSGFREVVQGPRAALREHLLRLRSGRLGGRLHLRR
jgi:hypothetical protein